MDTKGFLKILVALVIAALVFIKFRPDPRADLTLSTYACTKNTTPQNLTFLSTQYTQSTPHLTKDDTNKVMQRCNFPIFNPAGIDNFRQQAQQKGFKDAQIDAFIKTQTDAQLAKLSTKPPFIIHWKYQSAVRDWIVAITATLIAFIGTLVVLNLAIKGQKTKKSHSSAQAS